LTDIWRPAAMSIIFVGRDRKWSDAFSGVSAYSKESER
jgi:hypothetical protein